MVQNQVRRIKEINKRGQLEGEGAETRLTWFGYMNRMEKDRKRRKMDKIVFNGSKPSNTPRKQQIDEVTRDVAAGGIQWWIV